MASQAKRNARKLIEARAQLVYRADEPCLTYRCPECGQPTVTAVVDPGTPPETLGCLATPGCRGRAVTNLADRSVPDTAAGWEWYRPDTAMIADVRAKGGPLWAHVSDGGMMLRHRRTVRDQPTAGNK